MKLAFVLLILCAITYTTYSQRVTARWGRETNTRVLRQTVRLGKIRGVTRVKTLTYRIPNVRNGHDILKRNSTANWKLSLTLLTWFNFSFFIYIHTQESSRLIRGIVHSEVVTSRARDVSIQQGGINTTHVELRIRSRRGKGLNSIIEIFA